MRVFGIDPGYGRCGVAVVEKQEGKEVLLYSDCIETPMGAEFAARLLRVADECARLIREYAPDSIAMEKVFFSNNQKTAMQVAEVRGALINCASGFGLTVSEYSPGEVKVAIANSGKADKKQIAAMLRMLIAIKKPIKRDDEYDAIAIAVAHLALKHGDEARKRLQ